MNHQSETPAAVQKRQDKMNRAALLVRDAAMTGRTAAQSALRADTPEKRKEAAGAANRAGLVAWDALGLLVEAGAVIPEWQAQAEQSERGGLDLTTLANLDTSDARELLALLEAAQVVAERVDAARGHVLPADLPLQPGESRGIDLAETVSEIAARVRGEVFGRVVGRE